MHKRDYYSTNSVRRRGSSNSWHQELKITLKLSHIHEGMLAIISSTFLISQVKRRGPKGGKWFPRDLAESWLEPRAPHSLQSCLFPQAQLRIPVISACSSFLAGQIEKSGCSLFISVCLSSLLPSTLYAVWTKPLPRATAPLSAICVHPETQLPRGVNLTY